MAHNELRHRARLHTDLVEVPMVEGNAQRLEQVFLNLLVNATQALPEGRPGNEIGVVLRAGAGEAVVEITDNGPGIPVEILPRIFDPFFTTRRTGTGIGLAISRNIIEGLGGRISVASTRERGTDVRIELPVDSSTA